MYRARIAFIIAIIISPTPQKIRIVSLTAISKPYFPVFSTICSAYCSSSSQVAGGVSGSNPASVKIVLSQYSLPGLFPKRRIRSSTAFLHDPLHYALKEFFTNHDVAPFKECVICFCLVYDRELPQRRIKDYDNMELKLILDVISSYALFDDSGLYCDDHHTTELGETDQTIVYIMEKNMFPDWLGKHMKAKNTLSENM